VPRPNRPRPGRRSSPVAAAVAVLVLAGCGSTGAAGATPGTAGTFSPWVAASIVGRRVATPTRPVGPGYTYSPSPLVLPSPVPAATSSPSEVAGPCWPLYGPGYSVPIDVTTATGSITVKWYHNGDPATLNYFVGVMPRSGDHRNEPNWTTFTPTGVCGEMTATIGPLASGVTYLLQLDRLALTPETIQGRTRQNLNQLGAVLVP